MKNFKFFTEPLTYLEASLYLRFFPSDIVDVFSTHLGGTMTVDGFRSLTDVDKFSGIMAWFCLDTKTNSLQPKVFLAFQGMSDFIYPETPEGAASIEPLEGKYVAPDRKAMFEEDLRSIPDHNRFLCQDKRFEPTADNLSLTKTDVQNFSTEYISNDLIKPYQRYAHGYFANSPQHQGENFIHSFLNQGNGAVKYVRYYFGFHSHASPNFIRILLAPVDAEGKNLVGLNALIEAQLLQKSVPPPPYT